MGTPTSRDYKGVPGKNVQMASLPRDISLLPTPNTMDNMTPRSAEQVAARNRGNGDHGGSPRNLRETVVNLLPTPNTLDSMPPKTKEQIQKHRDEGKGGDRNLREAVIHELPPGGNFPRVESQLPVAENSTRVDFGKYEPAVRRWEEILGRPAPNPTEPTKTGQRLSPRFSEWVMGLPDGWVTDTGISREGQFRAIGNGVCPQQAVLALRILLEGHT